MFANRNHPRFDLDMEILCLLPAAPVYASIADIADDLATTAAEIRSRIKAMRSRRLSGICLNDDGGVAANRHIIRPKALRYWKAVYGATTCLMNEPSPTR